MSHGKGGAWAGALRFVERRRWLRSEGTGKSLGFVTRCKKSPKVYKGGCAHSQGIVRFVRTDPEGNNLVTCSLLLVRIILPGVQATLKIKKAWVKRVIPRRNPKDPGPTGGRAGAVYPSQWEESCSASWSLGWNLPGRGTIVGE